MTERKHCAIFCFILQSTPLVSQKGELICNNIWLGVRGLKMQMEGRTVNVWAGGGSACVRACSF